MLFRSVGLCFGSQLLENGSALQEASLQIASCIAIFTSLTKSSVMVQMNSDGSTVDLFENETEEQKKIVRITEQLQSEKSEVKIF